MNPRIANDEARQELQQLWAEGLAEGEVQRIFSALHEIKSTPLNYQLGEAGSRWPLLEIRSEAVPALLAVCFLAGMLFLYSPAQNPRTQVSVPAHTELSSVLNEVAAEDLEIFDDELLALEELFV